MPKLKELNVMPQLNTVNVVETIEDVPIQIRAFTNNKDGNEQAEKIFKQIVNKNGGKDKDMARYVEDGVFLYASCGVYLVRSS